MWEQCLEIGKINWKHNLYGHTVLAVLLLICSPLFMGIRNLEEIQVAAIMVYYLSFLGVILLCPLFNPDSDRNVRDLIASKKMPITGVRLIRLVEAVLTLTVLLFLYLEVLTYNRCQFRFDVCFLQVFAICLFQGALGLLFYSMFDNIALAYMLPFLYYVVSIGAGDKLGHFDLCSFLRGNERNIIYLLPAGIVMIIAALTIRQMRRA